MAVLSVVEKAGGRSGGMKPFGERTAELVFIVVCSQPMEETATIINASAGGIAVPKVGSVWPFDATLVCDSVSPRQDEEQPRVWEVRCTFTSNIIAVDVVGRRIDQQENPLSAPTAIHFGAVKYLIYPEWDLDDTAWANTAGDMFAPPPAIEETRQTISMTRNEATFNPAVARQWADVINSDTWLEYEPRMVKLSCPTARAVFSHNFWYWEVTYDFEVAGASARIERTFGGQQWYPGWQPTARNCGYRYKNANGQFEAVSNDGDAVMFGGLVDLDGAGHKLPAGEKPWAIRGKGYYEKPFAQLNLP
jgi:hypothetical protein